MFRIKRNLQLGCIGMFFLALTSPCHGQDGKETSALRYLIASENTHISDAIVTLFDTFNLVFYDAIKLKPSNQFDFIFVQKEHAIVDGKISSDTLSGIEGDVKTRLLEATSESDECYIEKFDIEGGWSLTIVVSTTTKDLNKSLQCSTVALSYHFTMQLPADLNQHWQTTYVELLEKRQQGDRAKEF
ncbi:hypothetical protein J7399_18340 [Shimia sp. R9_1]|uniref:hypothetical protein n=1 Tax=Shimia sp. R9_1 TaxID=2821111 RepID=UPI001ADA3F01|nr:hypothetical protein [Shimia sp. R9_1]MBO9409402.1 hypothetical protein [Shimia sp. R9_1]